MNKRFGKEKLSYIDVLIFIYITSLFNLYGNLRIIVEIACIALLLLKKLRSYRHVLDIYNNKYYIWGFFFSFICFFSVLWSEDISSALYGTRGVVECFLTGTVFSLFVISEKKIVCIIKSACISGCFLILKVFLTTPIDKILARQFAVDMNANSIGMKMAFCVIFILWLYKERWISRLCTFSGSVLFLSMVVLSGSKKALFMAVIGILVLFLLYQKKVWKLLIYSMFAVVLLVFAYWLIMNVESLYVLIGCRVEGLVRALLYGASRGDASTRERIFLIEMAVEHWLKRPWLGYGIHNFGSVVQYSSYGYINLYSHCNYVELLFGVGVVGTVLYYSIFVWIIVLCRKLQKNINIFKLLLTLIFLVLCLDIGMVSYGDEFMQFIIAFSCACIAWIKRSKTSIDEKRKS